MRNHVSKNVDRSPTALSSGGSCSLGILIAKKSNLDLSMEKPVSRDSNKNTVASSQVRQWDVNPSSNAGETCCRNEKFPLVQDCLTTTWQYPRTTLTILRKSSRTYDKNLVVNQKTTDRLENDVNTMIWRSFMSATMKAEVHLGQAYQEFHVPPRTRTSRRSNNFLIFHRKLSRIKVKKYVYGICTIDWSTNPWVRSTLLTKELSNCQQQRKTFSLFRCFVLAKLLSNQSAEYRELDRVEGEPVVFEWKFAQDTQHCCYFRKSKEWWMKIKFSLNSWKIESFSCRCTVTLIGEKKETKKFLCRILQMLLHTPEDFLKGHWSFFGPGSDENWYGTHIHKPNGSWNDVADLMLFNLRESGHPPFRGTSALFRGALKSKGGGMSSIHYHADPARAEPLRRNIVSVNQLSICGAVADWCQEFAQQISDHSSSSIGDLVAKVNDESEA